jgi:hypothetical protein
VKFQTSEPGPDGWTEWETPITRGYKLACCDCGLVHEIELRVRGHRVEWRWKRLNRSTGQVRRHMKRDEIHERAPELMREEDGYA